MIIWLAAMAALLGKIVHQLCSVFLVELPWIFENSLLLKHLEWYLCRHAESSTFLLEDFQIFSGQVVHPTTCLTFVDKALETYLQIPEVTQRSQCRLINLGFRSYNGRIQIWSHTGRWPPILCPTIFPDPELVPLSGS